MKDDALTRRDVFGLALLGATAAGGVTKGTEKASEAARPERLAERSLSQLREDYERELFQRVLPFWSKYGIDHERGGFMCALDYDGTRKHDNKFHWYQGRGIWVYSALHNQLDPRSAHLDIARRTKQFWISSARQTNGHWAELLSRSGKVVQPFRGDSYGAFTLADGCQELAAATNDDELRDFAIELLKTTWKTVTRRDYQDPYAEQSGWRVQGIWIYTLNGCTQMLRRWNDPQLGAMADECIEAIMEKHYNPNIGLNNEFLANDFRRIPSEANKSLVGHCIQGLWHVLDEALRRKDNTLYKRAADRIRRHLDVGWDHVYGGLCEWVNVNQFDYDWGPQRLGDQTIDLKMKGEYNYVKSFWSLNEVLVATLHIVEILKAEWAARYFSMAQKVVGTKFSRHRFGQSTHMLASDRQMTFVPPSSRQDNFHPLRRMIRNLAALRRMTDVG